MSKSFLQSSDWGDFQKSLGRTVIENPVIAIKHSVFGSFYYWYIPYVEKRDLDWVRDVMVIARQDKKCIFVRVEPIENIKLPSEARKVPNIQPAKTSVVDLSRDESELLTRMHQKTRYNIRVAEKHGVRFREITEDFSEAANLLVKTASRQDYKTHPKEYYLKLIEHFSTASEVKVRVLGTFLNGKLLAVGLFIDYLGTRTYLFGGSSDEDKNVMAPYLLHFRAMMDAKEKGMERYDFWGIETSSGETPGFVRFKLGFSGNEVSYMGAYDIVLSSIWYNAYVIFRRLNKYLK